jgi:hypothetical protein
VVGSLRCTGAGLAAVDEDAATDAEIENVGGADAKPVSGSASLTRDDTPPVVTVVGTAS